MAYWQRTDTYGPPVETEQPSKPITPTPPQVTAAAIRRRRRQKGDFEVKAPTATTTLSPGCAIEVMAKNHYQRRKLSEKHISRLQCAEVLTKAANGVPPDGFIQSFTGITAWFPKHSVCKICVKNLKALKTVNGIPISARRRGKIPEKKQLLFPESNWIRIQGIENDPVNPWKALRNHVVDCGLSPENMQRVRNLGGYKFETTRDFDRFRPLADVELNSRKNAELFIKTLRMSTMGNSKIWADHRTVAVLEGGGTNIRYWNKTKTLYLTKMGKKVKPMKWEMEGLSPEERKIARESYERSVGTEQWMKKKARVNRKFGKFRKKQLAIKREHKIRSGRREECEEEEEWENEEETGLNEDELQEIMEAEHDVEVDDDFLLQ